MTIRILHILFVARSDTVADYLAWKEQQETANQIRNSNGYYFCVFDAGNSPHTYLLITFKMLFGFNVIDLIGSDAQDRCFSRSSSSSDHV